MTTNWHAVQTEGAKKKQAEKPALGVKTRYLTGGSWLSNISKDCKPSRKLKSGKDQASE